MDKVVELQSSRRAATIDAAATAIPTPDEARDVRWDVLMSAVRHGAVDRPDVLSITHRTFDDGRCNRDLRAGALLPALTTPLAHRERNLKLRAAGRLAGWRAIEDRAAQRRDEGIIGQVGPVLVVENRPSLAQ